MGLRRLFTRKYLLFTLLAILFSVGGLTLFLHIRDKQETVEREAIREGEELVKRSAEKIDSLLNAVYLSLTEKAARFNDTLYSEEWNEGFLIQSTEDIGGIIGLTLCYVPYKYSAVKRLYCPFYDSREDSMKYVRYDYTNTNISDSSDWFCNPMHQGRFWQEPAYGPSTNEMVVELGIPFFNNDTVAGILNATFSLPVISGLIKDMSMGKSGYGFLLSQEGRPVTHPEYTILKENDSSGCMLHIARDQTAGYGDYIDPASGLEARIFYHPVKTPGWTLAVVLHKTEENFLSQQMIKDKAVFTLILILVVVLLGVPLTDALVLENLWKLSVFTSLVFTCGVLALLELHTSSPAKEEGTTIRNKIDLTNIKAEMSQKIHDRNESNAVFIPTGVQIHNIEILGPETAGLSGTLWQTYPANFPKQFIGFDLKGVATDAESSYIQELEVSGDSTLFKWEFRASIINNSNYRQYPFDHKNIYLEIRPKAFGKNVYLVPDLDSYSYTHFVTKPGLDSDLPLIGWDLEGSYYDMKLKDVKTDYGQGNFEYRKEYPFLNFNISLRRNIANPLIGYFIPIFILLLMLFAVLSTVSKKNVNMSGFNSFGVVNTTAAFFFVAILSHIDLRTKLGVEELTYLEYFYFVTYIYLLLVTVNSILFTDDYYTHFIDYKNNIFPKVIFWPLYILVVLGFTFWTFYE